MLTTRDLEIFQLAVAAAVRAPSMHNSQPWHFRYTPDEVEVWADPKRSLPVADPTGWGTRIACGAATLNLRLALAASGLRTTLRWRPNLAEPDLMAAVTIAGPATPSAREQRLHAAIPRRHSNRMPFWSDPVPPAARSALIEAAGEESAWLELLTGALPVSIVGELAQAANRVLTRDEAYVAELRAWIGGDGRLDGVPASAAAPAAEPQDLFPQRPFGGEPRGPGRDFEPEPLVGVLGTRYDDPVDQLCAGAALQRVLLTATDLGLATSMISQPIEVPAAREQLRAAVRRQGCPQMVLRIGYGQPGTASPRRSIEDVIEVVE